MFDPFTLALIGGAVGGLTSKKDPLKGALLGAGLGASGGAFAKGMMGAGGSAATQTAGLLGQGASSGAGSQAAMLAAQNEGFGSIGQEMLAQAAGTKVPLSTGLLAGAERLSEGMTQVKPVMDAVGTAMQVQSMFQDNTPMPVAQSSLPPRSQMDVSGLIGNGQVAQLQQKRMARRGLV